MNRLNKEFFFQLVVSTIISVPVGLRVNRVSDKTNSEIISSIDSRLLGVISIIISIFILRLMRPCLQRILMYVQNKVVVFRRHIRSKIELIFVNKFCKNYLYKQKQKYKSQIKALKDQIEEYKEEINKFYKDADNGYTYSYSLTIEWDPFNFGYYIIIKDMNGHKLYSPEVKFDNIEHALMHIREKLKKRNFSIKTGLHSETATGLGARFHGFINTNDATLFS